MKRRTIDISFPLQVYNLCQKLMIISIRYHLSNSLFTQRMHRSVDQCIFCGELHLLPGNCIFCRGSASFAGEVHLLVMKIHKKIQTIAMVSHPLPCSGKCIFFMHWSDCHRIIWTLLNHTSFRNMTIKYAQRVSKLFGSQDIWAILSYVIALHQLQTKQYENYTLSQERCTGPRTSASFSKYVLVCQGGYKQIK